MFIVSSEMTRVLIGTSGWHYESWRGPFFPKGLPTKSQLQYYASQFTTAELNGVFYRTPTREAVRSWREQTGSDFVFAWKASKFITHWKRLSENSVNSLELLEDRLLLLGEKAGPVLFQLPPNFQADPERLEDQQDVREQDRSVDPELRDRQQGDLGRQVGSLAQLDEADLFANRTVLGLITTGLSHQPDRRVRRRFTTAGLKEGAHRALAIADDVANSATRILPHALP